jgi:uncharacterized damage-inducible protein DinB
MPAVLAAPADYDAAPADRPDGDPMPNRAYFVTLAQYNAWANRRLYDAVAKLDDSEYRRPRPSFFGSIHATLNHILVADRIWSARVAGLAPPALKLNQILFEELSALRTAREAEDEALMAILSGLAESALDGDLTYANTRGEPQRDSLQFVLGHMFNHQTHHRGQVHDMLSQTDVPPPELDLIYFIRERQRREAASDLVR